MDRKELLDSYRRFYLNEMYRMEREEGFGDTDEGITREQLKGIRELMRMDQDAGLDDSLGDDTVGDGMAFRAGNRVA